jgi:vitamin B12 transporter
MNIPSRSSQAGRLSLACALAASLVSNLWGQTVPIIQLEDYVVTAARTPQSPDNVASSVTVITSTELTDHQIDNVGDALRSVPGVNVLQTGGTGGVTYLSLRGDKAGQTLLMVDGVRFNDANSTYQGWLGGFSPSAHDRIEVLRGPQSTLYGGAAMGGVVSIGLQRGFGAPSGSVDLEAGSFDTSRGVVSLQGEVKNFAFSFTASGLDTDNDRPNNNARLQNYALRLDYQATANLAVGGTVRYLDSYYKDPNDIRTTNTTPINNNYLQSTLGTVFAEFTPSGVWRSRVTAGYQRQLYDNDGSFSGFPSPYSTDTKREIGEWQNNFQFTDEITAVAGASYERSEFSDGGSYPDDHSKGVYSQAEWAPLKGLRLGAGVRYDDYDSFGGSTTYRLTASELVAATGTRFHATYGTSFLPPSITQRYGSAFTVAAPGIQPEESKGWDAGVEQTIIEKKLTADATFFRNDYNNLIAYKGAIFPALGSFVNIGKARTQGVETSLKATPCKQVTVTTAYTYIEATDEVSQTRLDDRPRHTFSANVDWTPVEAWLLGAGVQGVTDRRTTNFNTSPSSKVDQAGYTVFRLYTRYQETKRLTLHARVENLFDANYEETYGFPSAGAAVFAGAEFKF